MQRIAAVVIGAGQTGLAMSRHLSERSIEHVLLERGEVANSWRNERWDSLRLLTPNWLNRLPGYGYPGDDPDGYMTMPEIVDHIATYADTIDAPVESHTEVTSVQTADDGFRILTTDSEWSARAVVIASGPYHRPHVPAFADAIPSTVRCLAATDYRNPDQLEAGDVMVVGAASTGVQLAEEIHRSGRPVTLAVGGHVRMPRVYRGMDIMWWLDAAGVLDERYDEVDDIVRARHVSSFQLVGSPARSTVDLNSLQQIGVRLVGRLAGITDEGTVQFSGSLPNQCALADLKLGRLLDALDDWAIEHPSDTETDRPERFPPTNVPVDSPLLLPLRTGGIKTILWATGYRPEYPWLHIPVLDAKGAVRHVGGVTRVPGLYVMGTTFLRRRKSTLIVGADDDARELSTHLCEYLGQPARIA
ncbi:MAG TPA: NAD(P)-binding domain-containing protein [Acidimicrobiales bacterium]|nr:NAD(P)-binding domain-containing protein [Acidimicrobiales bacterium]